MVGCRALFKEPIVTRIAFALLLSLHIALAPAQGQNWIEKRWVQACGGALLAASLIWAGFEFSRPDAPQMDQAMAKQMAQERADTLRQRAEWQIAKAEHNGERWETTRGLDEYDAVFKGELKKLLATLGPSDHWIDMGSGDGRALLDYYLQGGKAHTTGITFERKPATAPDPRKMRSLVGRYVEEIPIDEIIGPAGKPKVITDLVGPVAYTSDLHKVLSIYEEVLADDGVALIVLSPMTLVMDGDKGAMIDEWLLEQSKSETIFTRIPTRNTDGYSLLVMRKVKNFHLPQLDILLYEKGVPPARMYWVNRGEFVPFEVPLDATLTDRLKGTLHRRPLQGTR